MQKTRNNYKLVTDTPIYVQAVKSGKQLSDVSAHWESYCWESKDRATAPAEVGKTKVGQGQAFSQWETRVGALEST